MSKIKQQDKFWNNLSEEKRDEYRNLYREGLDNVKRQKGYTKGLYQGGLTVIVDVFGEHNLESESPTPKTWEDVKKEYPDSAENLYKGIQKLAEVYENCGISLLIKCQATLKISKIIELGYGGILSEEEWKDTSVEKWCIIPCNKIDDIQRVVFYFHSDKRFIAFHTEQQAEEFMSYESNRKLVEQYYMM